MIMKRELGSSNSSGTPSERVEEACEAGSSDSGPRGVADRRVLRSRYLAVKSRIGGIFRFVYIYLLPFYGLHLCDFWFWRGLAPLGFGQIEFRVFWSFYFYILFLFLGLQEIEKRLRLLSQLALKMAQIALFGFRFVFDYGLEQVATFECFLF
jgi:hypothetical protein